eukprot:TRINITY_DN3904_c0_g1_i1.p1 TRINITY_DN3904_c0_g1~~TRINITY_DN3904_c0_g1_i1.p1  ORF type:complete len:174 (-),score=24.66 TRINITY_DN3904_c0_g1_i1:64-549(-)
MSNWIAFTVLGVLFGMVMVDLQFDHYSIIDANPTEQQIKSAISYYHNIETQPLPYNAIIPGLIAIFAIDFAIRLVKHKRSPDFITLFLLIAAIGSFVVTLMTRAKLVESTDYKHQKELVKVIAYSHAPQLILIPLGVILQLWSQKLGYAEKAAVGDKKKRA